MDEGLGDEMASSDVVERAHLRNKDGEYSLNLPQSSSILESHEALIPGEGDYPAGAFNGIGDVMEGNDVTRGVSLGDASDQPCASPRYTDDAGNMVEELMVRDYDSSLAIVSSSNNRERIQARQAQWPHLYQLGVGSASGKSHGRNIYELNGLSAQSGREDVRDASFDEFLQQNSLGGKQRGGVELLHNAENMENSGHATSHHGIRTKIVSKSGFSDFFIKSTLKGKGVIFRDPSHNLKLELRDQHIGKAVAGTLVVPGTSSIPAAKTAAPSSIGTAIPMLGCTDHDGASLREWLNGGRHKVNKVESLQIFRQIVDLVDCFHSQGVTLHDLRPSCFKLLHSNQVKYLGHAVKNGTPEVGADLQYSENCLVKRRPMQQSTFLSGSILAKKQKLSDNVNFVGHWPQFTPKYGLTNDGDSNFAAVKDLFSRNQFHPRKEDGTQGSTSCWLSNAPQQPTSVIDGSEEKWYMSPEELAGRICSTSSNIYGLGVLLFELFGHFDSERARAIAMSDLRHRILPPHFLSENAREAGFCLWLLHPEASSRPTTREILLSEVISGLQEVSTEALSSSIEQDDAESDLLAHFLVCLQEDKQKHASKLAEEISCLEKDIEEVVRRKYLKDPMAGISLETNFTEQNVHISQYKELENFEMLAQPTSSSSMMKEVRFMSNMSQLQSAYLTMRSKIQQPETGNRSRPDIDLLRNRENEYLSQESDGKQDSSDSLGAFFDGLCKYARYSKLEVRGLLRTGDFNNSANVICSLSFDRDADYFAVAGISKKIRVFDINALIDTSVDIHYPVIEMSNKSKLSCTCWNNYIKNYLASTGYDGVVKLWDVSTGQGVFQFSEHQKRAWSVDFSQVYPTKFASGSDDCSVKLWNINEKNSLSTIRNIANVCCVQFASHSTHLLAFGSADYKTYCYDLRNVRTPWCVLVGHTKAVSYVKFLGPETLVTASTDNSLKLWDLNKTSSTGVSSDACILTLSGHMNEKNFVGLSVANGYIACGSETNEVYAYHKSLPMPITSHKFGSIDTISGKETDDDNGQFVSSVCWRGDTDMVIAANSSGCIKVLQMV